MRPNGGSGLRSARRHIASTWVKKQEHIEGGMVAWGQRWDPKQQEEEEYSTRCIRIKRRRQDPNEATFWAETDCLARRTTAGNRSLRWCA